MKLSRKGSETESTEVLALSSRRISPRIGCRFLQEEGIARVEKRRKRRDTTGSTTLHLDRDNSSGGHGAVAVATAGGALDEGIAVLAPMPADARSPPLPISSAH